MVNSLETHKKPLRKLVITLQCDRVSLLDFTSGFHFIPLGKWTNLLLSDIVLTSHAHILLFLKIFAMRTFVTHEDSI